MTADEAPARSARRLGEWPWRVVTIALVALLVGAVAASAISLALTLSMGQLGDRLLRVDVSFEDEAEDVHVAVLDLRHEHRNLALTGPTRAALADHAAAVSALREEVDELAAIEDVTSEDLDPGALRAAIDGYAERIHAATSGSVEPSAYDEAFDQGLATIAEWERATSALDTVASTRASDALRRMGDFTSTAAFAMVAVLVAVSVAGLVLVALAIRFLRELRRLSAAERASASATRELLQARTDFIADASHELRTPLTVIRGTAELALREGPSDDAHVVPLREISAEAVRMGRLVEELLFIARHDAGGAQLELVDVGLDALLADIGARAEALTRQRGVELETDIEVVGRARLDDDQVGRAVLALVDNAARHSPTRGTVRLEAEVSTGELRIAVLDRGPGIPADALPYIFERFRRGRRSRGRGGAGLGLAIARAVVEAHAGTIAAEPRDEGGTRMSIRIPLRAPAHDGPAAQPAEKGTLNR